MKLVQTPGARVIGPRSRPRPKGGETLSTIRFVNVMLPTLHTMPVNRTWPPGGTFVPGQKPLMARAAVVRTGQLVVALAVTLLPQRLVPLTVTVLKIKQPSKLVGTV